MTQTDLTAVESHFRFGENWRSFAEGVTDAAVDDAVRCLGKLFPDDALVGKRFLDIGCGSGLSMLAALKRGAEHATGVDIDADSVTAAQRLLGKFVPSGHWAVELRSVFDLAPDTSGTFDVVHSWGVLHHTGAMWRAIDQASKLVRGGGGLLAIALYHKTPFCGLWTREKRLYTHGPEFLRKIIRVVYKALFVLGLFVTGRNPFRYIREYRQARGMDWAHDVHDWLGGYPYEAVLPDEVTAFMLARGFEVVSVFENCAGELGVFGTGCDEFVYRRL